MYNFLDYQFWLFFLLFIVSVFLSFYIPGYFLVRSLKLTFVKESLLAHVLGIVLFGVQGYIFGYLGIRWMTFIYVLSFALAGIYIREPFLFWQKIKTGLFSINKLILFLIGIGTIIQLLPLIGSGIQYGDGIRFFGNSEHDGVMHISFIQSITTHFPPVEPGAYELPIINYHYWSDLVIAELARVWGIPIVHLFFQFIPFYVGLLTSVGAYAVVRTWGGSKVTGWWVLFLLYFGGDGAYLLMLYYHNTFGFFVPAIDNGATQFLNMPHSFAKMIFLTALIPLHYWIETKRKLWGIITVLLLASVVGFKVYFGIYAAIGFSLLVLFLLAKQFCISREKSMIERMLDTFRKENFSLGLLFLFAVIAMMIYLPPNKGSGGIGYYPLEWAKIFLSPGNLDVRDWWLQKQVFESHYSPRIYLLYVYAMVITLVCIHGTRLLGFLPNRKLWEVLKWEKGVFLVPGLILFHFLGMFTLQSSGGLNVYNFFVVGLVVLTLFAAFTLADLTVSKNVLGKIFLVVFIVLTIPRVVHEISYYVSIYQTNRDAFLVTNEERDALRFIERHASPNAIVQSHPNNKRDSDVPYVAFFTKRLTYLTGISPLEIHNQKINTQKKTLQSIFAGTNEQDFVQGLKKNKVEYVYLQKVPEQQLLFPLGTKTKVVYENKSILVVHIL